MSELFLAFQASHGPTREHCSKPPMRKLGLGRKLWGYFRGFSVDGCQQGFQMFTEVLDAVYFRECQIDSDFRCQRARYVVEVHREENNLCTWHACLNNVCGFRTVE